MKPRHIKCLAGAGLIVVASSLAASCQKKEQDAGNEARNEYKKLVDEVNESGKAVAKGADIPILPVEKGDFWVYEVKVQIPEGVKAKGSPAEMVQIERKRTYIGKVKPGVDYPETGCFEIEAKDNPVEREFVDIDDERILMRGSVLVGSAEIKPMWLEPGVLLVRAGLLGGESLPPVKFQDPKTGAERLRVIQIIGRETVKTPVRSFETIRILMTGNDGGFELRRTIWFAPHIGIVKEEKARYVNDTLVLKESVELKKMQLQSDHPK